MKDGLFLSLLLFVFLANYFLILKVTTPHAPGHWIPRHFPEVIPWNFCEIPQLLSSMYVFYQRTKDNCYILLTSCIRRDVINLLEQSNIQ